MIVKNNTNLDVESTAHGQCAPSELDPLIRHDTPVPTKKQSHLAFLQFLAFCSALFMVGWTDGSTGPLLPTINRFYGVGYPIHVFFFFFFDLYTHKICRSGSEQYLGYLLPLVRLVIYLLPVDAVLLHENYQGMVMGALLNMPLVDRLGLGKVSF